MNASKLEEIVNWLREKSQEHMHFSTLHAQKAKEYAEMAERVLRDSSDRITASEVRPLGEVTPEAIRAYLMEKNARPADLARHFNVLVSTIREITDNPTWGIETVDRGWLKLAFPRK